MVKKIGNIWEVVITWGMFLGFTLFCLLYVYPKEPEAIYPLLIPIVLLLLMSILAIFEPRR